MNASSAISICEKKGNIRPSNITAKGFDEDNVFMLIEIDGDRMHFQAISRRGQTIDSGVVTGRGERRNSVIE